MPRKRLLFAAFLLCVLLSVACGRKTEKLPPLQGDITELAGEFLSLLQAEDYTAAVTYFDATMKKELPPAKLQEAWETVQQQAGPYRQEVARRTEEMGRYRIMIITARFGLAQLDIRLTFNSDNRIAGLYFLPAENPVAAEYEPPSYGLPAKYSEQDVTVGQGEWALPGTLTIPDGEGLFPAVILVHGSGPQDRDETIGPNKPFKDLALGLANQGIAVLRYDKRTLVHGAKFASLPAFTVREESMDDAVAAFSLLQAESKIRDDKIFLLGHSLGGTLAPRIGAENKKLAGLIILAGAVRPLEELLLEQSRYLAEADGKVTEAEAAQLELLAQSIEHIRDPNLTADTPPAQLLNVPASYWLDLRGYNPAATARDLQLPLLILQGERDYQVTMEDFALWQDYLAGSGNATLKSYPGLNHLFQAGEGISLPAEYELQKHVDAAVIDDIARWIKAH
ncbi:MAG TPA: alpha/beta fold hydrolase [Firmicutes bacterium]|nr:alpha/beta fold hydrolase [Bacillota bacterium]